MYIYIYIHGSDVFLRVWNMVWNSLVFHTCETRAKHLCETHDLELGFKRCETCVLGEVRNTSFLGCTWYKWQIKQWPLAVFLCFFAHMFHTLFHTCFIPLCMCFIPWPLELAFSIPADLAIVGYYFGRGKHHLWEGAKHVVKRRCETHFNQLIIWGVRNTSKQGVWNKAV